MYKDITTSVDAFSKEGYSSNLEGITITNDSIFIVSDNMQQNFSDCDMLGRGKTLLLHIQM